MSARRAKADIAGEYLPIPPLFRYIAGSAIRATERTAAVGGCSIDSRSASLRTAASSACPDRGSYLGGTADEARAACIDQRRCGAVQDTGRCADASNGVCRVTKATDLASLPCYTGPYFIH